MTRLARALVLSLLITGLPVVPVFQGTATPEQRTWSLQVADGPVRAPEPVAMVGVSWPRGAQPTGDTVAVRTSMDGRRWSGWTQLDVRSEEGPDLGSPEAGRTATDPLWVGEARYVDVRWPGGHRPAGTHVELVDPGPDPSGTGLPAAEAATERPTIISRSGWGADESIRRCCPRYAPKLKVAFVHHTATGNGYSREEADDVVRAIYAYHVRSNGWDDIGYNLLVDRYGRIYEGRAGGVERAVIGAHARGFNTGSTGVAVIGNFNGANPPQAALDAVDRLLAWKLDVHHVDPEGTTTMTSGGSNKHPEGRKVELSNVSGHRDVGVTSCPGGLLYDDLGGIRQDARSIGLPKIFDPDLSPKIVTPNGDGKNDKTTFSARFSKTLDWDASIRNARGETVRRFSGSGGSAGFSWNGTNGNGQRVPFGHYHARLEARDANPARPAVVDVRVWRYDRPIVGIDGTEGGPGYWLVADDGAVLPAGAARSHGSMAGRPLAKPIVGMTGTPTDDGYWLVASDGGIFTFGDAKFKGSMGGKPLVRPVVGMAPTSSGNGYWQVASDGGIFTFGDAKFKGSMGGAPLDEPVVGMAPTNSGNGYWLVATDGGVFTFGDAKFKGSTGGQNLSEPIIGMAPTPTGEGYWLVGRHGKVYAFGDAEGSGVVPPL